MKVGLMVPQGWKGEYAGWDAAAAWARSMELARDAEALGYDSLWAFDHFHTVPQGMEQVTFEAFALVTALATETSRVRIGPLVACTGFRAASLTAKIAGTIDVISGGRLDLGLGAGWYEAEWRAYGFEFPRLAERLAILGDQLEVIRRMLEPGRATFEGEYARVLGAINEPKGLQKPRIPIVVGGNGRNVTFRYAARFADELNLVYLGPAEVAGLLPVIRQRCEEEDRDPASLDVSLYLRDTDVREAGAARVDLIGQLRELGLARIMAFVGRWSVEADAQASFAEDSRAAGAEFRPAASPTKPRPARAGDGAGAAVAPVAVQP